MLAASRHSGAAPSYKLFGFGGNSTGNLGNGSTSTITTVTQIGSGTSWSKVYGSRGDIDSTATTTTNLSFVIKSDNTLWTAGSNSDGATGLGTTTGNTTTLTQVGIDNKWVKIATCASTPNFTLAIKNDGTLWGWGDNSVSQLGTGNTTNHTSPFQIGVATDWADVSCSGHGSIGDMFAVAVKTTGTLWGWGSNLSGGTGQGTTSGTTTSPTQIGSSTLWKQVACGSGAGAGVAPTSTASFALAVRTDGTLWGWGINGNATINNTGTNYTSPIQIGVATLWDKVFAGGPVGMAIRTDGTLWSWGCNRQGGPAQGSTGNTFVTSPTQVGSATNWQMVSLSCQSGFSGAAGAGLRTDGTLWAWGSNSAYNLGSGSSSPSSTGTVTQVGSATTWTWVSAGGPASSTGGELYVLALST